MTAGKRARKEEQAIAALLSEPTIARAAQSVGIGERTLRRWLADPTFRERFAAVRRELVELSLARIESGVPKAVDALLDIVQGFDDATPAARVAAARVLIEKATEARDSEGLVERVRRLEERVDALT